MRKIFKKILLMTLTLSMICTNVPAAMIAVPYVGNEPNGIAIASDEMKVVVDPDFPRVIEYHKDGKKMNGQEKVLTDIKINEQIYQPLVRSEIGGNKVIYHMSVAALDVEITAELAVKGSSLEFNVIKIQEDGEKVKRFEIPDHSLLSIRDDQPEAFELGINVKGGVIYANTAIEERNYLKDMPVASSYTPKSYLLINNHELAGAIVSNAMNTYLWGANKEQRNISYANETKVVYQVTEKDGHKQLGAWSYPWTYREYDEETMDLPSVKVAITSDINNNGTVDWQDGAIACRQILPVPKMSEESKKSFFHIAYTRASLSQWPFDKTLDMVKKLSLYTDGFGQFLQYKGYQAEGHDSNHPDYGDSFNSKAGGVEGLNNLVNDALQYNCRVGVHLNHTEAYPEAKNYTYDLVTKTKGWDSLDLSMKIDRYKDAVNDEAGGLGYRLNQLKENVPNLSWVYYDVYEAQGYAQWKLAQESMKATQNSKGLAVGSEFQGALDTYSIWSHVQCQSSPALRIMRYNTTDQFFYDPILLESRHAGSMGYGDDSNQDQGTGGQTIDAQMKMFYSNNLLFKYMQNHDINETVMFQDENRFFDEVYFDGGVTGRIVSQRDRSSGDGINGSAEEREPIVELIENGRLVARYQKKFEGKTTDATRDNGDSGAKKIIPMMAQYLIPWDTDLDDPVDAEKGTKLYHYNTIGGTTVWELPESWYKENSVTLYELTDTGRRNAKELEVTQGTVSIAAEAEKPYIICKQQENGTPLDVNEVNFGAHTLFSDPGFDTKEFGKWEVSNPKAASILTSETSGETFVEIKGEGSVTVSQKITGLEPGKEYQLSVWAEVKGQTAQLGIENGGKHYENEMKNSDIANNYYNSLRYNDVENKMQRLKLGFRATQADAIVYLTAVDGKSDSYVDFDDFRLIETEYTEYSQETPDEAIFFWDFELANDEGFGPFVPVQNVNRAHLSETHLGYTSDTIQGKYSFKIRDSVGGYNHGEAVRTISSNMNLENNKEYTIQFDYWMKSKGAYDVSISAGFVPGHQTMEGADKNNIVAETLDYEKTAYSKTFMIPDDGREYGLSFFKNLPNKEELIIDNLVLYEGAKELPAKEAPTYDFEDSSDPGSSGVWVSAMGSGKAEVNVGNKTLADNTGSSAVDSDDIEEGYFNEKTDLDAIEEIETVFDSQGANLSTGIDSSEWAASPSDASSSDASQDDLETELPKEKPLDSTASNAKKTVKKELMNGEGYLEMVSDRYDTIVLDKETKDIADGSLCFDITSQNNYNAGVVVRYTNSKNYFSVRFVSEQDGWQYVSMMDGEGKSGTINMPGILLKAERKQHVEFSFQGENYKLVVDGILLFDGRLEGTQTQAGRLGFITSSRTPILIDNMTIKGKQAETGSDIINEGNEPEEDGVFTVSTWDDAYIEGGTSLNKNFGLLSGMKVKNDGDMQSSTYWRQAYLKFQLPDTSSEGVENAVIRLYLTSIGATAKTENIYIVNNDWSEETITASTAPVIQGEPAVTFNPQENIDGFVEIDMTEMIKEALQSGETYISLAVNHAAKIGGSSDIMIASFENPEKSYRPKLTVTYDETASGIRLNHTKLELLIGETAQLVAETYSGSAESKINWSSENEMVAMVDENGLVEGITKGTTKITAEYDGKQAFCSISVKDDDISSEANADTYIQDNQTSAFGSEKSLKLKNGVMGYNREIFLKFPIPENLKTEELLKADVKVFITELVKGNGLETISLIPVDTAWNEDLVTWKNHPEIDIDGAVQYEVYKDAKLNSEYAFDITSQLKEAIKDNKTEISFLLKNTAETSGVGISINSRESESGKPVLKIISTYTE